MRRILWEKDYVALDGEPIYVAFCGPNDRPVSDQPPYVLKLNGQDLDLEIPLADLQAALVYVEPDEAEA